MKIFSTKGFNLLLLNLLLGHFSYSQLVGGDIAFSGMISAGTSDAFSFYVLKDVPSGTVIRFTDNGYFPSTSALGTAEGTISWTTNGIVKAGTQVLIEIQPALRVSIRGSTAAPAGTLANVAGTVSIATGGDSMIAYIAGTPNTYLGALNMSLTGTNANWDGNSASGPTASAVPPGLTNGVSALRPGAIIMNLNVKLNLCTATSVAELRTNIYNENNWTGNTTNPQPVAGFLPACNDAALPVKLVSFSGRESDAGKALLTWETDGEESNSGFEIQKSRDARSFTSIGFVDGRGTTQARQMYQFADYQLSEISYYRLRQIDIGGASSLSRIISVIPQEQSIENITISPNPTDGRVTLKLPNDIVLLQILDTSGKIVLTKRFENQQTGSVEVSSLPAGMYVATFATPLQRTTKKLLVK
jgi:flagellar hook assembly protein FlgD